MKAVEKVIELNHLFESDSQLLDKLLIYWANVVCNTLKLKYPMYIFKTNYTINRYIQNIEIEFKINDDFVTVICLNLNIYDLPKTDNMADRIIWLYKERNYR